MLVLTRIAIFMLAPLTAYLLPEGSEEERKRGREEAEEKKQEEVEEEEKPKTRIKSRKNVNKTVIEPVESIMPAEVVKDMSGQGTTEDTVIQKDAEVLKEKISELSILHEASKALGASLILEEVLETTVDITIKGLMADVAGAFIYDEKAHVLTMGATRGFDHGERDDLQKMSIPLDEGILGMVFGKKVTYNIPDMQEEKQALPFNGRIKPFIATPLATDGYEIGVLFIGKYTGEPFSEDAEEFIETIAGQAAIAIENAKLYTQAQELAIHNGLTGIYNYRYFMRTLEEEIKRAERYNRCVSLIMLDIDHFKLVNDTYGHQRGDEVLRGLAEVLIANTRDTDMVCRYGGEEFVVILPETDLKSAIDAAAKLNKAVAKAHYARKKGESIKLTISLGVSTFPDTAANQEELLRQADDALYEAKKQRDAVCSWEEVKTITQ
jgi:diguanylate cyclase (GGDEF)-like protein